MLSVNVRQQNTFEVSCLDLFFLRDLGEGYDQVSR